MSDIYKPWSHIIATLRCKNLWLLKDMNAFKTKLSEVLMLSNVIELWSFYYEFDWWGFTGVIALQESHISLHTRPECELLTLDIFLCNYSKDNSEIANWIFREIKDYFASEIKEKIILKR